MYHGKQMMKNSTKLSALIALLTLSLLSGCSYIYCNDNANNTMNQLSNDGKSSAYIEVNKNIYSFLSEVQQEIQASSQNITLAPLPTLQIENTPELMFYNPGNNQVTSPYWEGQSKESKQMFNTWVENANMHYSAEVFFKKNFNWFLVPHELGHYLDFRRNKENRDFYGGELRANKIAITYLIKSGQETELLEFLTETDKLSHSLRFLPEGTDEPAYFTKHYDALSQDPSKYGYYQFSLYRQAYNAVKEEGIKNILDV